MIVVRRFASVLAVALAVLVTVQTLDLVPCADETEQGAGHSETGGSMADCLCHITFTRTGTLPAVADAPVVPRGRFVALAMRPTSAEGPTLEHVPLG